MHYRFQKCAMPSATLWYRRSKPFNTCQGQGFCGLQVLAVPSLVAVVKYGQLKQWSFAAAPSLDDLSGGSFSGGNASTTQGHHGYWVAQQVLPHIAALLPVCPVGVAVRAPSIGSEVPRVARRCHRQRWHAPRHRRQRIVSAILPHPCF